MIPTSWRAKARVGILSEITFGSDNLFRELRSILYHPTTAVEYPVCDSHRTSTMLLVQIATLALQVAILVAILVPILVPILVATRSAHGVRTRPLQVAILVAIPVATRLVHCVRTLRPSTTWNPERNRRQMQTPDFHIQDLDLLVGPEMGLKFFDQICEQPLDSDGGVSGAYNPTTNEFMTWTAYLATVGRNYNPNVFHAAHRQWHTFRGECFWNQYQTYVEDGPTTKGPSFLNNQPTYQTRPVYVQYYDPGFEARTSIPSWVEACKDRQYIITLFENLVGLERVITVWEALRNPEPQIRMFRRKQSLIPFSSFHFTVTTVVRTVRVTRVFFVTGWFSTDQNNQGMVGTGWMGWGAQFIHVQSPSAWIEGIGLQRQRPDPASYVHIADNDVSL
jgi:hypothetical protein